MQVFLALYKGKGNSLKQRLFEGVIRLATGSIYSHCELALALADGRFQCYSASARDGGVRMKTMRLPGEKWDLISLPWINPQQITRHFEQTKGAKYDLGGAFGVILPLYNSKNKYFCSEWCANVIFGVKKWAISPAELAKLVKNRQE